MVLMADVETSPILRLAELPMSGMRLLRPPVNLVLSSIKLKTNNEYCAEIGQRKFENLNVMSSKNRAKLICSFRPLNSLLSH
jgi:hypothetical protein